MAYQTYITEALVCGSRDQNTSDRAFLLLAREAGMVWASARSVRVEKSKQRFALQDFSHLRATLVRGKGGWRLAGVEPTNNMYFLSDNRQSRTFLRNTIRLLKRVMQGDTPHPELFDDVLDTMLKCTEFDAERLECILSLRILHTLGYVAPDRAYENILNVARAYDALALLTKKEETAAHVAIEHALLNSQL
jgi:recombinational DNA repair protein (RecF pathway)